MNKPPLYERIKGIIESARAGAARSVNTAQVVSNWLIGREIVEEEQKGSQRAAYGERLMRVLAERLKEDYRSGYGLTNLKTFRQFYLVYDDLLGLEKGHALRGFSRRWHKNTWDEALPHFSDHCGHDLKLMSREPLLKGYVCFLSSIDP